MLTAPAYATDLYDAARAKDLGRVVRLLNSGADPNIRSPYDGPLHVAARFGPPEMVVRLLEAGADIELTGYGGAHPLHAAALAGNHVTVTVLLERGAKADSLDNLGRTPLLSQMSGAVGDLKILKALLLAGANPNMTDGPSNYHALDYAAISGQADVAELLLAFGADINAKDSAFGRTPLHHAISYEFRNAHYEVVKVLIDNGADVNAADAEGLTPLEYARRNAPNNGLLHRLLVQAGAK